MKIPQQSKVDPVLFIGLGAMGFPMARVLMEAGTELHVMSGRAAAHKTALVDGGAVEHSSLGSVPPNVQVAILMLPTAEACREVVQDICASGTGLHTVIDCSTISPVDAQALASVCKETGIDYLDAPVSGGVPGAEAGQLTVMVGGDQEALARVEGVLQCLSSSTFYMGPSGAGQVIKACNNLVGAGTMLVSSLSLVLAERFGIPRNEARSVIRSGTGANWQLENHLPRKALKGDYEPGFAVSLLLKDLGIAESMMGTAGLDGGAAVEGIVQAYEETARIFGGDVDFSSVMRVYSDSTRTGE